MKVSLSLLGGTRRFLSEGQLSTDVSFETVQLWNAVVRGEELRLIHGFSASPRILPEQSVAFLTSLDHRGKAYVLHLTTRLQGGGSGGKNPQTVAI